MRHIEPLARGYRVRIIRNHVLHTVGIFPTPGEAVDARDAFLIKLDKPKVETSDCTIRGVTADELPDFGTAYSRAREEYQRKSLTAIRKASQRLDFNQPVVCIVFSADHHIGNSGTDIDRIYEEAQVVAETPQMYAGLLGDVTDNYIVSKLQHLNFNQRQAVKDQPVLAEHLLEILGEKLMVWGGGNHDGWSQDLTGVDSMRDMVARHAPHALYDTDDCQFVVNVAGMEIPTRARHKWRGSSILNDSHGCERAWRYDHDFRVAIGAHLHPGALVREFNAGGEKGIAVVLGTYKTLDTFRVELGIHKPLPSTAAAVIYDAECGDIRGYTNLEAAARAMRHLY